jgi:hypothetical protein
VRAHLLLFTFPWPAATSTAFPSRSPAGTIPFRCRHLRCLQSLGQVPIWLTLIRIELANLHECHVGAFLWRTT